MKNINLFFKIFDKPYKKFCLSAASLEFWMIGGGWLGWKLSIIKMNGYNFRYCTIGSLLQVLQQTWTQRATVGCLKACNLQVTSNLNSIFSNNFDQPCKKFCWSAASLEFWMIGGGWLGWKLSIIKMNGYNFRYCTIGSLLQVLPDVGHEEARRNGLWNMTNFTIMARYLFSTKIRIELWPSPGHEEIGWFSIIETESLGYALTFLSSFFQEIKLHSHYS